jgi:hypothetical protein
MVFLLNETSLYWAFRAHADWTLILPSELPTKVMRHLARKISPQTYQTSQFVVPRGGFLSGKWRSPFVGSSDGKMNVKSAYTLMESSCSISHSHGVLQTDRTFTLSFGQLEENL